MKNGFGDFPLFPKTFFKSSLRTRYRQPNVTILHINCHCIPFLALFSSVLGSFVGVGGKIELKEAADDRLAFVEPEADFFPSNFKGMGEEQQQWVQVPSDFFNSYQAWKENLIKKQQESFLFSSSSNNDIENSRIGAQSVYEKAPPIPGVSILKKQVLNQTELAPAGSSKFRWE